jgi:hypothetical protein
LANPAGARAEISLRQRSLHAWPKVYPADFDELRRAHGTKLLIHGPAGLPVLNAEYKSVEEGPLDLNDWQHQAVAAAASDDLPTFTVQFTHPEMRPSQPWAFRLWPLNKRAEPYGIRTYTEQHYVWLMFVLANRTGVHYKPRAAYKSERTARRHSGPGTTHAQAEAAFKSLQEPDHDGLIFDATDPTIWEWFGKLDGHHPQENIWPAVRTAPIGVTPILRPHPSNSRIGTIFAEQFGVPFDANGRGAASVTPIIDRRPTLGAIRRRQQERLWVENQVTEPITTTSVPQRNVAALDRYEQLKWATKVLYEKYDLDGLPSDDNRSIWRHS